MHKWKYHKYGHIILLFKKSLSRKLISSTSMYSNYIWSSFNIHEFHIRIITACSQKPQNNGKCKVSNMFGTKCFQKRIRIRILSPISSNFHPQLAYIITYSMCAPFDFYTSICLMDFFSFFRWHIFLYEHPDLCDEFTTSQTELCQIV